MPPSSGWYTGRYTIRIETYGGSACHTDAFYLIHRLYRHTALECGIDERMNRGGFSNIACSAFLFSFLP